MEVSKIKELAAGMSIRELDNLIGHLRDIRHDLFHETYHVIEIHNYRGNISDEIRKEFPELDVYHRSSSMGIGTNIVLLPKELTEDGVDLGAFTKMIKDKYDSFQNA